MIFCIQLEQHGGDAGLEYKEELKCSAGYYNIMEVAEWDTLQSAIMKEPPMMNTTATTNATSDTNATRATVEEQQQQQQTTSTIPALLLE